MAQPPHLSLQTLCVTWCKPPLTATDQLRQSLKSMSSPADHDDWRPPVFRGKDPGSSLKPCSPEATPSTRMPAWLSPRSAAFRGPGSPAKRMTFIIHSHSGRARPLTLRTVKHSSVTSESLVTGLLSTKAVAFGRGMQSH